MASPQQNKVRSMNGLAWFRMYVDFLDDPKILSLAFEDQRHFVGVCALKASGTLDQECGEELMDRIVAQKLWIDQQAIKEVKRRLISVGLIDQKWHPLAWNKRQFLSDADPTNAERQRRFREKQRNALRNGQSITQITDTDTDTDTEQRTEQEQRKGLKDSCAEPEKISGTAPHDFDLPKPPAAISPEVDESTLDGGCKEADSEKELVIVNLPLNDGSERAIRESDLPELVELYPNCDVITELRNMRGWLLANHARRKTKRGIMVFVHGWFRRAQDGPPARASPAKAAQTLAVIQRKPVNNKHVTDRTPTGGVSFYDTLHSSDGLKTKMFDEEEIEYEARRV